MRGAELALKDAVEQLASMSQCLGSAFDCIFPTNAPCEGAAKDSSTRVYVSHVGDPNWISAPGFSLVQPKLLFPFGQYMKDLSHFLSLSNTNWKQTKNFFKRERHDKEPIVLDTFANLWLLYNHDQWLILFLL